MIANILFGPKEAFLVCSSLAWSQNRSEPAAEMGTVLEHRCTRARISSSVGRFWSRLGLEFVDSAVPRTCLFSEFNGLNRYRTAKVVAGANPPKHGDLKRRYAHEVSRFQTRQSLGLRVRWASGCTRSTWRPSVGVQGSTLQDSINDARSSAVISTPPQRCHRPRNRGILVEGSRTGKGLDKYNNRSVRVCRYGTAKLTGWFSPDGDSNDDDAVKGTSGLKAYGKFLGKKY